MIRARIRVDGRLVGGLQALVGGTGGGLQWQWRARWEDRTRQESLADRAGASWRGRSVVRWMAQTPALPSGRKWNRSQPRPGAAELGFPRPVLGKLQGEAARRVGEPSGEGEEPPPEGLGGHDLLAQTDSRRPAGQVVGHRLYRQPGGVGGEAARGEMVQTDAVLEVADGILDLERGGDVGLQFQGLPVPVGDEAVIAVVAAMSASSSRVSPSRSVMKP